MKAFDKKLQKEFVINFASGICNLVAMNLEANPFIVQEIAKMSTTYRPTKIGWSFWDFPTDGIGYRPIGGVDDIRTLYVTDFIIDSNFSWSFYPDECLWQRPDNHTSFLPDAYIRGENLTNWFHNSQLTFENFTSVGYVVYIKNASFTGIVNKLYVIGKLRLNLDAYGENFCISSPIERKKLWETNLGVSIEVKYSWASLSISFHRSTALCSGDLKIFLRAWLVYEVIPNLKKSSKKPIGITFPEYNYTGRNFSDWIWSHNDDTGDPVTRWDNDFGLLMLRGEYKNNNKWMKYLGYYVLVYDVKANDLKYSDNQFEGEFGFSITAFGNNSLCAWEDVCEQITVSRDGRMHVLVNGNKPLQKMIQVEFIPRQLLVDPTDFLIGYFYTIMVPIIVSYYDIIISVRTFHLPNYHNETQINIDCSKPLYYCQEAKPSLIFFGVNAFNLSITINSMKEGLLYGKMNFPFSFHSDSKKDLYEGNVTISIYGVVKGTLNNSIYIDIRPVRYVYDVLYDECDRIRNSALDLYVDEFMGYLQLHVNDWITNNPISDNIF